ncbi:MAG: hypothetical protein ABFD07_01205 [Methanobacterium sp.]
MSKSFKKYPSGKSGEFVSKEQANRIFRRRNKQLPLEDEETIFFKQNELVNSYDITDYKFTDYQNQERWKKLKRK